MKAFATWIMKGRMQAVVAATVLAVLALLVTPLALLSAAVVILTVLRQGWREGAIVVGSALSLIAGLGDLMPPTALAGLFAAHVVGVKYHFEAFRACLLPGIVTAGGGVLIMLGANWYPF